MEQEKEMAVQKEIGLVAAERTAKALLLVSHRAYELGLLLEMLAQSDPGDHRDHIRSQVVESVARLAWATTEAEILARRALFGRGALATEAPEQLAT
jgi:hypothetical protein